MKLFTADWVCPVSTRPVRGGGILVSEDRIEAVGSDFPSDLARESFPGCAIVPAFVNVHTHLELTLLRGFLEGLPFVDWIRELTRTKYERLSRDDLVISARLGALECLAAGVTTVGEVMDVGAGWEAMRKFGLRGVAYQETFGPDPETAAESIERLRARLAALGDSDERTGCRIGVSPHAPYTVSRALYEDVQKLSAQAGLPLALHIGESRDEVRFVRDGEGPFAEHLESRGIRFSPQHVGPVEYVAGLGLLTSRTLAIHAIEVSDAEIGQLQDADVSVAHCPKSNLKLGHRIAPLREFLDRGIRVGLGSDSVASNNVVDMFEEMRTAVFMQGTRLGDPRAVSAREAFELATLGGARCLGLGRDLGSLEPGKLADFAVVNLDDLALQPVYDPVDSMVFSASRLNVRATFKGGIRVRIRAKGLVQQARAIAARLRNSGSGM